MTPTSKHPIWDLYDLQRDSRYYGKLYCIKVNRLVDGIFWSDLLTTGFAGSSAIAGIAFWKSPIGQELWVLGTAVAAVISLVKPLLHLTTKLKNFQDLYSGYLDLELDCQLVAFKVRQSGEFNQIHRRALLAIKEKERAVARRTPPQKDDKRLAERLQKEVNRELPVERFYIPPETKPTKESSDESNRSET